MSYESDGEEDENGMRMEMGRTLFLRKLTKRQRKQAEKQNGLSPCQMIL